MQTFENFVEEFHRNDNVLYKHLSVQRHQFLNYEIMYVVSKILNIEMFHQSFRSVYQKIYSIKVQAQCLIILKFK